MKILVIISTNPFFSFSAFANRWLTLIEGLSEQGVEIEMLISSGFNTTKEFNQNGFRGSFKGIKYRYIVPLLNGNVWLRRINLYILIPILQPFILFRIAYIAKKEQYSIIWPSCYSIGLKAIERIKRSNPNAKTFIELSEFPDVHRYNPGTRCSRNREEKASRLFEDRVAYKFDVIAVMTKTLHKYYENLPNLRAALMHLPMTVDLDRFTEIKDAPPEFEKPYMLYLGAMANAKEGITILIKAFYRIKNIDPELKLYLVGPWYYDTPEQIKLIQDLNMQNRILWMGEYSREQVPSIIQNAEILLLPRPNTKQAQGGFPTKLGEYLATGVPVCATSVGELPDYLKDNESVFFAEPDSVESFEKAMLNALTNKIHAIKVGRKGQEVAHKNFDKRIQSIRLKNFLENYYERKNKD